MKNLFELIFTLSLFSLLFSCNDLDSDHRANENPGVSAMENNRIGEKGVSALELKGSIKIKNVGRFDFDPEKVDSVRKDIFKEGHFSLFDILVHLDYRGDISMVYHLEPDMNTFVIDSINGKINWWAVLFTKQARLNTGVFRVTIYIYLRIQG